MTLQKRRLDDWLSSYIEFTENTETPLSYHTWTGISCLAGAMQRKVYYIRGHEVIYPNQYIVLVGPSGRARKGQAVTIGRSILEALNIPLIGEDNSQEAVILDIKNSITNYRDEASGNIRLQCAVSCFSEELAVFLGYQNTTFLAYLTNWYDSRDKWTRRTKHQGTDEILGMCFNLLAATAPEWLPHILTREAIGGGFTSRCMFVVETDKKRTISNPNLFPINLTLRENLIHDLEIINTLSGPCEFDEAAQALYDRWYEEEDELLRSGRPALLDPAFSGYVSRRATHLVKLCMALSVSSDNSLVMTEEIFKKAKAILETTERKMPKVFGGVGKARYAEETELIIDYLKRRKKASKSDILKSFYRNVDTMALDAIVKVLYDMKFINITRDKENNETLYEYVASEKTSN